MAKIVVANMKNALCRTDINNYINIIDKNTFSSIDLIICPSSIYLSLFNNKMYSLGAQDVYFDNDLCTGELSAKQLKDIVKYVIVGHSERRRKLLESDYIINKKIINCLDNDLNVILCVGEDAGENTKEVLEKQILSALNGLEEYKIQNIVIAYEPVYFIGADNALDSSKIKEVVNYIKQVIYNNFNCICNVIYGGGVNESNIKNIINVCDGVMVGSLCFSYEKFLKLVSNI